MYCLKTKIPERYNFFGTKRHHLCILCFTQQSSIDTHIEHLVKHSNDDLRKIGYNRLLLMTHANPELRQKVAKDVQEMADLAGVPLVESAVISMDSTRQNESSY